MKKKEYRNLDIISNNESRTIEGFIPYNTMSEDLGFFEILKPGCFTKTLRESKDIRALYGHDDNRLLARTKNQSLTFEDKEDGLHFSFNVPETTEGNDVLEMVRSGLIDGCSFGFSCIQERYETLENREVRYILEARLYEVSLVGEPAYSATKVMVRSLSEAMKEKETLDDEDISSIKEEIESLKTLLPEVVEPVAEQEPNTEPNHDEVASLPLATEEQLDLLAEKLSKIEDYLNEVTNEN